MWGRGWRTRNPITNALQGKSASRSRYSLTKAEQVGDDRAAPPNYASSSHGDVATAPGAQRQSGRNCRVGDQGEAGGRRASEPLLAGRLQAPWSCEIALGRHEGSRVARGPSRECDRPNVAAGLSEMGGTSSDAGT
jgi:hypothetical protein